MRSTFGLPSYFDGDTDRWGSGEFYWEGTPHLSRSSVRMRSFSGWNTIFKTAEFSVNVFSSRALGGETSRFLRGRDYISFAYGGDANRDLTSISTGTSGIWDIESASTSSLSESAALVEPSVEYSASIAATVGKAGRLSLVGSFTAFIVWRDIDGVSLSRTEGEQIPIAWGGGETLGSYSSFIRTPTVTGFSPAEAAYASVGVRFEEDGGIVGPDVTLLADTAILVIGDSVPKYFDGATLNDSNFTYSWDGEVDESESTRVGEAVGEGPGPIVDPSCPPPPPAPMPPQPAIGCEDNIEEWRRVWYVIPAEDVYEWGAVIPSFTLESGAIDVDAMRITIWENPGDVLPENFDEDQPYAARWNVSYLPANSSMTIDGTTETITATQPGGTPQNAGYLVTGPGSGPVLWSKLTCGDGYLIAVDTPLGDDPENITLSASLTREFG